MYGQYSRAVSNQERAIVARLWYIAFFRAQIVIFIKILPVRLAFDAIEEVEPEVTAAAAAAIEVDVGKAVMDDAAEDDPGIQKSKKNC